MLSNSRFYHKITRNAVIAFGSLFSNIYIQRTDSDDKVIQSINVPLMYSKKQKFMAAVLFKQDPEDRQFQQQLPRMGFEIVAYKHAPERKMTSNLSATKYTGVPDSTKNSVGIPNTTSYQFASSNPPVPYTLTFNLYLCTKNQDDMLQIAEQILPYFNPTHSLPVNWIPELGINSDFPITIVGVEETDTLGGALTERAEMFWTITFTANVNYYGAIRASEAIKTVKVGIYTDTATPLTEAPTTEYTLAVNPITAGANDNYGFMEGWTAQ